MTARADQGTGDELRWPVTLEIPVAWGDMDAFRHVNNTVYARWMESARIAYFERTGMLAYDRTAPILARQAIDYRRPVEFPDTVVVEVRAPRVGNTSFELRYRVTSRAQGAVVAEGEAIIVLFDYVARSKVTIPPALREAIEAK